MRILIISRCPPYPLYLGDRLIVYHLARELELRRHDIHLLAFANRPEDHAEQNQWDGIYRHAELIDEPHRTPLDYTRRQLHPASRFPRRAQDSWSPTMWQAIQRQRQAFTFDAVLLFGSVHVYEYLHALAGQPAVITPYESYSLYLRRQSQAQGASPVSRAAAWARWQLARAFERWMFAPYARTVVVSPRDRDELLALNPSLQVDIIPNGVDTYEFRPRPTGRVESAVLFTGNYEYAPNVDAALRLATEIFPRVQARVPAARLWLVGNAPPPELTALASETVKVTGRVPDVRPYLARASAFISPLRLGAGIKNKVLEALAMACPVVATPLSVDGIHVTDGHDALIRDGDNMVDAVVALLEDADLRARLGANGRALIESAYSWDSVGARYERLLQEVAGR